MLPAVQLEIGSWTIYAKEQNKDRFSHFGRQNVLRFRVNFVDYLCV